MRRVKTQATPGTHNPESALLATIAEELRELKALLLTGSFPPGYLTIDQAATYLNAPVGTLRGWMRTKGLPHHKPGKELHFRVRELDQWMFRYKRGDHGMALTGLGGSRRTL